MIIRIFVCVLILTLAACGSSGGDDDAATTAAPTAADNGSDDQPGPVPSGAAAIDVPDGFDFASSTPLAVEVALGASYPDRAYLTLCRADDNGNTDYDQCLLRTSVDNRAFRSEVEVPNDVNEIIATVWSFNPGRIEATYRWSRDQNGGRLTIN